MNEKQAKRLRKLAGYNPEDDPINTRKYSTLVTVAGRKRTGYMLATKGRRLIYRQMKKRYKEMRRQ